MASLIRYEGDEELKLFLKEDPPANLRKLFAEKPCRVRVHVYGATSLAPRAGGKEPEPFLKVYNVEGQERTTRDIALPPSLEPDFYQSFELSAILPGQSRLHLEVRFRRRDSIPAPSMHALTTAPAPTGMGLPAAERIAAGQDGHRPRGPLLF
jgi:hypothetical protein